MYRKCYRYDELLPTIIPDSKEPDADKTESTVLSSGKDTAVQGQVDAAISNADNHSRNIKSSSAPLSRSRTPQTVRRHFTPAGSIPNKPSPPPVNLRKNRQSAREPARDQTVKKENPIPINADNSKSSVHIPTYESKSEEVPSEEELKSSLTSFTQSATDSLKGLYQRLRKDIMKNGKVLGLLETDDLIIILVILILISEESEDYILILALFALLFLK